MRRRMVSVLLMTSFLAVSVAAGSWQRSAQANSFGGGCVDEGGGTVCYHYNESDFIRYFVEGGVEWSYALAWNRSNNVDPTDLDSSVVSLHSNSDAVIQVANYGDTGWAGQADCIDESGNICLHWHLQMNTFEGPFSTSQKRHLVCHEAGHGVGLRHIGAAGCVIQGAYSNLTWSSHDVFHINQYYP